MQKKRPRPRPPLRVSGRDIAVRNAALDVAACGGYSFRLPGLLIHAFFYYKWGNDPKGGYSSHSHLHWEISRVLAGRLAYRVAGCPGLVTPLRHHYLVIPAGAAHEWQMRRGPIHVNSFQVRMTATDALGREVLAALARKALEARCLVAAAPQHDLSEKILWEAAGGGQAPFLLESAFRGAVRLILTDLLASLAPWPTSALKPTPREPKANAELAARLREFIDQNLGHSSTLHDMASHFHYSARHLNRVFQQGFGVPIGRYLRRRRLDLAADWLADTDRSVKDIASSLGYRTLGQFCRYFHEHLGIAPTDYRARRRKGFLGQLRAESQWTNPAGDRGHG